MACTRVCNCDVNLIWVSTVDLPRSLLRQVKGHVKIANLEAFLFQLPIDSVLPKDETPRTKRERQRPSWSFYRWDAFPRYIQIVHRPGGSSSFPQSVTAEREDEPHSEWRARSKVSTLSRRCSLAIVFPDLTTQSMKTSGMRRPFRTGLLNRDR
jgi:hypothetical protein